MIPWATGPRLFFLQVLEQEVYMYTKLSEPQQEILSCSSAGPERAASLQSLRLWGSDASPFEFLH